MWVRALLLLILTLGGCAVSDSLPDWMSDEAAGPEPLNYRFIVANALGSIVGGKGVDNRILEISSPRRVDTVKGATWMVCINALRYPSMQSRSYFAVFIQREKIVQSRVSVEIDRCESLTFSPFDWKLDADRPLIQ